MNEAIVHHAARAVKMIRDSLGLPIVDEESSDSSGLSTIDEENDRRYMEAHFRTFRVPVTLTRKGFISVFAGDAKAAEGVAQVIAAFADDIENPVQTEQVGTAIAA